MATTSISPAANEHELNDLEDLFQRLAAAWRRDVMFLSSSQAREDHPAYRQIIALGAPVLPFLLRDVEQSQTHWFGALKTITGVDPVPSEHAGNIGLMSQDWLAWARERGLRW